MAVYHTQSPKGLGSHPKQFIQVIADTVAEFDSVHDKLLRSIPENEVYYTRLPFGNAAITKRGQSALIRVEESHRKLLRSLGSIEIPDGYFEVVKLRLRESYVRRTGPLDANAQYYFSERYKQRIVRLLRSDDLIPHPEDLAEYEPGDEGPAAEYERQRIASIRKLNDWIESKNLGRNSGLRVTDEQNPRALSKYQRPEKEADPTEEAEVDWVAAYLKMTPDERETWRANPANKFLVWKVDKLMSGQLQSFAAD